LIPETEPIVLDRHGHGLAAAYDAILSRDQEAFAEIRKRVVSLFPTVKGLQLYNPSSGGKALRIELTNKTLVDAEYMSEGLLFFLAFAALPYLQPTSILLVEEPENGLHPARIQQVMSLLRELSKTTQVILSTHSPLVVNELRGHEVSVLTRESVVEGTQVKLLKDTPRFEERSQVYSLGELWVSYANGNDEGPLLSGGARP
jgi:predicted ATPase